MLIFGTCERNLHFFDQSGAVGSGQVTCPYAILIFLPWGLSLSSMHSTQCLRITTGFDMEIAQLQSHT
jgi:hypothetical protein